MKKLLIILLLIGNILYAKPFTLKFLEFGFHGVDFNYEEFGKNQQVIDSETSSFTDLLGLNAKAEFDVDDIFIFGAMFEYTMGDCTYSGATWGGQSLNYKHGGVYLIQPEIYVKKDLPVGIFLITPKFGFGYRHWERGKGSFSGDYDETYRWPYLSFGASIMAASKKV